MGETGASGSGAAAGVKGGSGKARQAGSGSTSTQARAVPEGITPSIHREAVLALAADEPSWLRERRLEAWDVYERTPMPTTRLEEWRYTDLKRKLALDRLTIVPWEERSFDESGAPRELVAAMAADRAASLRQKRSKT